MSSSNSSIWLVLTVLGFVGGCAGFERGERLPDAASLPPEDAASTVTFDEVHVVLRLRCGGCHGPQGSVSSAFDLVEDVAVDYETVLEFVDSDTPTSSRLLSQARGEGHAGGAVLSTSDGDYQLIFEWIAQGAQR
jgi:hypothetical protein